MDLVSVVVPVYNVEKYLAACLDSLCNQTYAQLEIILVDDGSTDASGLLCEEYQKSDPRIRVIHNQNQGLSATRNCGLALAKGKYTYFLDSDDIIAPNAIGCFLELAQKHNADVVFTDAVCFFDPDFQGRQRQGYTRQRDYGQATGKRMFEALMADRAFFYAAPMLFLKTEFLRANSLAFSPGVLYEDVPYTYAVFQLAAIAVHAHFPLYQRRMRPGSIMTASSALKSYQNRLAIYHILTREIQELQTQDADYTKKYVARIAHNVVNTHRVLSTQDKRRARSGYQGFLQDLKAWQYWDDKSLQCRCKSYWLWVAYKALGKLADLL